MKRSLFACALAATLVGAFAGAQDAQAKPLGCVAKVKFENRSSDKYVEVFNLYIQEQSGGWEWVSATESKKGRIHPGKSRTWKLDFPFKKKKRSVAFKLEYYIYTKNSRGKNIYKDGWYKTKSDFARCHSNDHLIVIRPPDGD